MGLSLSSVAQKSTYEVWKMLACLHTTTSATVLSACRNNSQICKLLSFLSGLFLPLPKGFKLSNLAQANTPSSRTLGVP
eukprot:m.488916 g.488916  ORF g.488916 m.488916 type:complete len:79 (+) comp90509_c0_seq1:117-353(+)